MSPELFKLLLRANTFLLLSAIFWNHVRALLLSLNNAGLGILILLLIYGGLLWLTFSFILSGALLLFFALQKLESPLFRVISIVVLFTLSLYIAVHSERRYQGIRDGDVEHPGQKDPISIAINLVTGPLPTPPPPNGCVSHEPCFRIDIN